MEDSEYTLQPQKCAFLRELQQIAGSHQEQHLATLTSIDIAFNPKLGSLNALSRFHNLIELSLVHCEGVSVSGIESQGHSLEVLVLVGCGLKSMAFCAKLVNLKVCNLSENQIKICEGLQK